MERPEIRRYIFYAQLNFFVSSGEQDLGEVIMASTDPFRGKVIAITGAASGIGRATAHYLAVRGADLSLADIDLEALQSAARSIQAIVDVQILVTKVDIRDFSNVKGWIDSTIARFGKLSGAANVAAIVAESMGKTDVCDLDDAEWELLIDINLNGTFRCLRAELSAIEHGGSIVNVSSIAGVRGLPKYVHSMFGYYT